MSALSPFSANPAIRRQLCDPNAQCDFEQLLYEECQVVVLDMPMRLFGDTSHLVARLLRQRMMQAVISRSNARLEGYGSERFTFLLADEFQRHLALQGDAISSGSLDDAAWFESSREYGHINIVATQGVASLLHRADGDIASVNALLQNFGTMIALPTHDPHTHHQLAGWSRGIVRDDVLDSLAAAGAVGRGIIFSHHLERHNGPLIARIKTGHISGHPHMGRHLNEAFSRLPSNRFQINDNRQVRNPYVGSGANKPGRPSKAWNREDVERACGELREWFSHRHCTHSAEYLAAAQEIARSHNGEERQRCDYRFGGHRVDLLVVAPTAHHDEVQTLIEILHSDAAPDLGSIQHRIRLPLTAAQQLADALDSFCATLMEDDKTPPAKQPPLNCAIGDTPWTLYAFGRQAHAHLHLRRHGATPDEPTLDAGFGLHTACWLQTAIRGWLEVALHPAPLDNEDRIDVESPLPEKWLNPLVNDLENLWDDDFKSEQ
ncbi:hypothetical protein CAI21_09840 [Alkalilimnicola ehrlichii]|uniref:TraD/TraG TraM recognition site domain-containing protein n=1 Tax=Alkalilimnicola ehrlichii TaxID=351052 RepID=A0A3E0WXI1_9GAMM|nr:hypothetical protein CAI21_09840 [Alkalilimnicola ehrlichii]RFA36873.1 hypothetical protein CAL65_10175 [Alkalilimnicola ehrlichii]